MMLGRAERYTISQDTKGVTITMRQLGRGVVFITIGAAMTTIIWWFGPYGPHPAPFMDTRSFWLLWGFFDLFVLIGVLGALYGEKWMITEQAVVQRNSFSRAQQRVQRGPTVRFHVDVVGGRGHDRAVFPYQMTLLDAQNNRSELILQFQAAENVDRCLKSLRLALPVDVEGWPLSHGSV